MLNHTFLPEEMMHATLSFVDDTNRKTKDDNYP